MYDGCFQCVKGNKFESDSQHASNSNIDDTAVSNVSKVINLKAIHNAQCKQRFDIAAVSNVSKVINLKAIHNTYRKVPVKNCRCFQCVKGNKFESDSQLVPPRKGGGRALFPMCQR